MVAVLTPALTLCEKCRTSIWSMELSMVLSESYGTFVRSAEPSIVPYWKRETFESSAGILRNLMTLYKTIEGVYMMYGTIKDFTELSERLDSILRNLVKPAEPKKVVNKGHETFFVVPNLKWVGAKVVNLHSSVINLFFLQCAWGPRDTIPI